MGKWKTVGLGVAAATVGAAAFGAVHYMFLAPQFGVGDFYGIPLTVILPIALGAPGFILPAVFRMKDTIKDVVHFGAAASIGFGVAQYAGWITPTAPAAARARAYVPRAVASYVPQASFSSPNGGGVKII